MTPTTSPFRFVSFLAVAAALGGCEAIVSFNPAKLDGAVTDAGVDMTVTDTGPRDLGPDTGPVVDMGTDMPMGDAGLCASAATCDDMDDCTTDACDTGTMMCTHTAIAGCCNVDTMCDDSDACTTDSCTMATHTCNHPAITDCCTAATDPCDDGSACTTDSCNTTSMMCEHAPSCACTTPTDPVCADTNVCTTDSCDTSSHTCSNVAIAGCCVGAGDCDDGNTCTTDGCDGSHACTHTPIAGSGCCITAGDCDDTNACTTDTCSAAHMCVHTPMASGGVCCVAAGDCDDTNVCTDDTCDGTSMCQHANNTASCSGGGTCGGGVCVPPAPTCAGYCTAVLANCVATPQYLGMANCMDACTRWGWTTGALSDTSGNTIGCRQHAAQTGTLNCPAAGPLGGGVCGTSPCDDFCAANLLICTGVEAAYPDMPTCLTQCGAYVMGNPTDTSGAGLGCRTYHLEAASTGVSGDSTMHCPHTSMGGGGVCS